MKQDRYEDKSGDKKYFTIIPNLIANHSSANDQSLYFQMKKIVGDNEGVCYASEKYFKDKMKIGSKALKKSIKYLLDHKWIEDVGMQKIKTKGGVQKSHLYIIKDIWKMNIDYYESKKGVSGREPLIDKGVSGREPLCNQRGVQKESKGVAFEQQIRTYNKNLNKDHVAKKFATDKNKENKIVLKDVNERGMELAQLLYKLIKDENPEWHVRPNFDEWTKDINKIVRIDKRTYEQVEWMIHWCQQDDFWKTNILSPAKLRKQFNRLVIQAKRPKKGGITIL